jgi:Immunity protein 42
MIFGNPYEFAISWDIVPEWSNASFANGLLSLYVAGNSIDGRPSINATLSANLSQMQWFSKTHVNQVEGLIPLNDIPNAFLFLINHTYPAINDPESELNNSEEYLLSPFALGDRDQFVFLVRDKKFEYVIAGNSKGDMYCSVKVTLGTCARLIELAYAEFQRQHVQLRALQISKSL